MPFYVYTNVTFHLLLNTGVSSRLNTIPLTCLITIRYTYHSQFDMCFKMLVLTKLNKNGIDLFLHESKHYDFVHNQLSFVALIQHNKFLRTIVKMNTRYLSKICI